MYAREEIPLADEEWQQLETLLQGLDFDHVVGGDAAEVAFGPGLPVF